MATLYTHQGENIRKIRVLIGVFVCVVMSAVFLLTPGLTHATELEYIESFISNIEVSKDASFTVSEQITYVFNPDPNRINSYHHGIYRCIPRLKQEKPSWFFRERYIDVSVTRVLLDDKNVPYVTNINDQKTCIKIGDPNLAISGKHQYQIDYTVGGGIFYDDHGGTDLYWNVNGLEWNVPVNSIEAFVSAPDGVLKKDRSCYRGLIGERGTCDLTAEKEGVVHFEAQQLRPHEGITIAQALDRTGIKMDVRERYKKAWIYIMDGFIALLVVVFLLYKFKTHFRIDKTIVPQYEPYPGVKPMYTGLLFDGKLDPRDITAGIVYLGERGYIKISKTEKKTFFFFEVDDYTLTITKPIEENSLKEIEGRFEARLLGILFSKMYKMNDKGDYYWSIGDTITLSELKDNYSVRRSNGIKFQLLKEDMEKDLVTSGFFQTLYRMKGSVSVMTIVVSIFYFLSLTENIYLTGVVTIVIILALLFYKRRTSKGYEAFNHLKGFKEFLSVTERDRYIFHNAPQKNPEQFMEYLPYAIAFGVEKEWAKTFEGITLPDPTWYENQDSMSGFSVISLTDSLGSFSSHLASTTFAGSGGGGGFGGASGGGGFSGGGGGGGGGGSW